MTQVKTIIGCVLVAAAFVAGVLVGDSRSGAATRPALRVAATAPSAAATSMLPPFSASSPFNQPIGANPKPDVNSASMIAAITGGQHVGLLHEFAAPVVTADGTAPQQVHVENHWAGYYEGLVPFPAGAAGSVGSDGALVVLDPANSVAYDFWQVKHTSSGWSDGYGSRFSLTGDGLPGHGATGSDIPLLDGLIRVGEIEGGEIRHALSIASQDTCSSFRYPAFKSDGHGTGSSCLPEGARLQLDPSFDCQTLTPAALATVCVALERYGAYVKDTSGSAISVGFQDAGPLTESNPYYRAGWHADYPSLAAIPWSRVRVLAAWNSGTVEPPKEEPVPPTEPPPSSVPVAPTGCTAVTHREGIVSWLSASCAPSSSATGYVLWRTEATAKSLTAKPGEPWTSGTTPVFTNHLGVRQGERYCFWEAAMNAAGQSPLSAAFCVTA